MEFKTLNSLLSKRPNEEYSKTKGHGWMISVGDEWNEHPIFLKCWPKESYLWGVKGEPERWKWTLCHLPSRRCHTRVSSLCCECATPLLKAHNQALPHRDYVKGGRNLPKNWYFRQFSLITVLITFATNYILIKYILTSFNVTLNSFPEN